ncbi:cytosine permease [Escherichia coli]
MEHQRKLFQQRGYSEDLLPKTQSQRTWKTFNYFTLWMGSVHNVPNYVMVGGFFILGLSTFSIMLAIILSAFFIAAVMVLNGAAGSKYGVPFAMILRASYGVRGALFPGLLRGGIAAIMWFGLQCYAGSLACLILIGKIWPGFLTLGGDFTLLGLSLPGLITFLIFWLVNVGIGFGGGKVLNKFTAILNPCIYIVFGGMAIWAISLVGIGPIFDYIPSGIQKAENGGFLFLVVMRGQINLDELYTAPGDYKYYDNGFNLTAFSVTLVAVILSLGGKFIHFMEPLSRVSWFVGVIVAFAAYALLKKRTTAEKTGEQKTIG